MASNDTTPILSKHVHAQYEMPDNEYMVEIEVKRSKFLSTAIPALTPQDASQLVKRLKHEHPQASHVCWAYIAGAPNSTTRSMSDDGEPSGTAGMPMLKILEHSGLGDIAVAVVRYFGGTKLGTGGLQRAYSDATSAVLNEISTQTKVHRSHIKIQIDYSFEAAVLQVLAQYDVINHQCNYSQHIDLSFDVSTKQQTALMQHLQNVTGGKLIVIALGLD